MTGGGANNQFDELTYGKRTHITQWDLIQYKKKAAAPTADEYDARYIIPLSKYKKKVKYTNPEDICKDGGLVKKILKPGDDKYQHVDDYDYVLVKYEARLDDGTLVRKSDDDGVEFKLNNGHFCPALSIAVKTMKIGEKVILTVKPQCIFSETETVMQALNFIKYDTSFPDEDREIVSLRVSCNLSNTSCLMKLKDYERANKYFKGWLLSPIL